MNIDRLDLQSDVLKALEEDVGSGDVTAALLPENRIVIAEIISRETLVVCGIPWVEEIFTIVDPSITLQWLVKEGEYLNKPSSLCIIKGQARTILTAERTALNFLQTLSATATQTYHYVKVLKGSKAKLLDTRKTIPGLRKAQKYAVACAGGVNHRIGLYDAYLIKENHIKACGSVTAAVALAKKKSKNLFIEVEVETIAELQEALAAKPDRILLDNFDLAMLTEAVALSKKQGCELEASGGVNLSTIAAIAKTGVDYISVGAITKSIQAIDLSLLIRS
jgi:nicotinate-nucleotide pyrophosphorylase (carboxylating)